MATFVSIHALQSISLLQGEGSVTLGVKGWCGHKVNDKTGAVTPATFSCSVVLQAGELQSSLQETVFSVLRNRLRAATFSPRYPSVKDTIIEVSVVRECSGSELAVLLIANNAIGESVAKGETPDVSAIHLSARALLDERFPTPEQTEREKARIATEEAARLASLPKVETEPVQSDHKPRRKGKEQEVSQAANSPIAS